ncbi:MAG TPA: hypothetical protein VHM65_04510, partial [Candidatus Lustribacter sp.]|nr:hypothetical protein [Candidatus Lustribacter sp.]
MIQPPVAKRVNHIREHHGERVVDEYEWLRDAKNPEVIAHLTAENRYAEERLAHLAPLREAIFQEIKGRTQETDLSVPVALDGWWYYARSVQGKQYALQCRAPRRPGEPRPHLTPEQPVPGEQLLLDGNVEAGESDYFALGASEVSIDGDLLAFAADHVGDERFAVTVRRIATGEIIDTAVSDTGYGLVWSLDGRYLFYTRVDDAWRPHQVWRHEVGTATEADVLVYDEPDERFWVGLGSSRDDRWILLGSGSKTSSEVSILDAADPLGTSRVITSRRDGIEYDVEVVGDRLFITHNGDHPDFDLAWAPLTCASASEWQPCRVRGEGERVVAVDAFTDFAVVSLRSHGLTALRILPYDASGPAVFGAGWDVVPEEELYTIGLGANLESATRRLQVVVESMVTPHSIYDYDVDERTWTLLKRQPVLGGYDPGAYRQHRAWVTIDSTTTWSRRVADSRLAPSPIVYRSSSGTTSQPAPKTA